MKRTIINILIFTVVSYVFLHLSLLGYGEIATEMEEVNLSNNTHVPSYHPDVVIYESQKAPADYGKIVSIVFGVLMAFILVYFILKFKATAIKYLILVAIFVSLTYSLRGLLPKLPLYLSISFSIILVFLLMSKKSPAELKTFILALIVGGIAGFLGSMAYPYIWAAILVILMVYDFLAVHKGPMKSIAEASIEMELPLLIKIRDENFEHFIGLGDYVFPMTLIASLLKYGSQTYALVSLCGMFFGALFALIIAEKRGPVPGLVYIVPPTLVGFILYVLSSL